MVEGALGDASLASIEAHVDRCERCAAVIGGLGGLGALGPGAAAGRRAVGRYQLDRRIAAGGMGEVWAAWDPQLRREIAVKLVRPERADDGRERERLLREARALARLGHPNVLAVYDVGEVDGEIFLATELVAGETLASRGGPSASWRELVRLYTQAARGLAAAHAAGLVHRDVKPSNLLLGADGRVRVADFGLAVRAIPASPPSPVAMTELATEDAPRITASGFVAGTPAYMAPEQRAGQPPDARADQYALCVSLLEAIDGRRPAPDRPLDRDALIALVSERRPHEPELDALCGVLARGLAADPRRRYSDTDALADALERVLATRELESAVTVSAAELPPSPSSGPASRVAV
jgi:serine/threonine protein kinase